LFFHQSPIVTARRPFAWAFDDLSGSSHDDITIQLTEPATIRGQVVDASGAGLADVSVRAIGADDRDSGYVAPNAKTDEDGNFELTHVRGVEVMVQVEPFWVKAAGQEDLKITAEYVTVKAGETKEGVQVTKPAENERAQPGGL
jgi:hypothetical protein